MLRLRKLGLLHEDVLTVTGNTLGENLDWWGHVGPEALDDGLIGKLRDGDLMK